MSQPLPAIVFDLGKVLVDFDYEIARRRISARCAGGDCNLADLIGHSPLLVRFETGLIGQGVFYEEVKSQARFLGDAQEFSGMFADIFSEIPEMIGLQADLRRHGYKTYIFSNTNPIAVGHIRERFPFYENFDDYILSYAHGSMKPDPALYRVVEQCTRRSGPDLVYIDDRPENIHTGDQMGWRTVLHEAPAKTMRALAAMGIAPAG